MYLTPLYALKRQAKSLARSRQWPLHKALDHVAQSAGFAQWSALVHARTRLRPGERLLERLRPGECVLLGGRPGHGKTTLGLELLVNAAQRGRSAWFFSLESTVRDVEQRLEKLGIQHGALATEITVDCSDAVAAPYIAQRLSHAPRDSVVVVDYMQILDQRRELPSLADQVDLLSATAKDQHATIVLLSQIDRVFEIDNASAPGLRHLRLPNPVDLGAFSQACFVHAGRLNFEPIASDVPRT